MNIQTIQESDAEQFLSLCKKLDTETQFMMLEPGERTTTVEKQRAQIKRIVMQENQIIFVAEHDSQLIGIYYKLLNNLYPIPYVMRYNGKNT